MRRHKFNAVRTEVDGIKFASKKEAARYRELRLLARADKISFLETQQPMVLEVNGVKLGKYVCDFMYRENGNLVVEDVKGYKTPVYRLKKKLVKALYGIEIQEV